MSTRFVRWWNFKQAEDAHRIVSHEGDTWTLMFHGRRRRKWGFWSGDEWVYWRDYVEANSVS